MSGEVLEAPHTLKSVQQTLGLSRRVVVGLVDAGVVTPQRGARNEYRFTFQDVVLLKTAHRLQSARVPLPKMLQSLRHLRRALPESLPLTGLRIRAVGGRIAVSEAAGTREVESGQLVLDFEVVPAPAASPTIDDEPAAGALYIVDDEPRAAAPPVVGLERISVPRGVIAIAAASRTPNADELFRRGELLEVEARAAAEEAYRAALALDGTHASAYLNLGAMLCESGRSEEAVELYAVAVASCPDEPLLHFNRAIALEDTGRWAAALGSYRRCLVLAPDMADAHFNAARLYERSGDTQSALRHFSSYRRLQQKA